MKADTADATRLDHLDGLRALAAAYVVLFHAVIGFPNGELEGVWRVLRRLFSFGHEAVAVFIVLSGYCLMLPVVRRGDRLPRTVGSFVARRAWRILPPYYAALALSLALIAAVPLLRRTGTATTWDDSLPAFGLGPVVSHLLLVHNWIPEWAYRINGPFWSVATEWQIYFFFPWVLLPLWRRRGLWFTAIVAGALGYLPLLFAKAAADTANPWYLLLFTFGMGAAAVTHSARPTEASLRSSVPWAAVTRGLWAAAVIGGVFFGALWFRWKPVTDLLVGAAAASLLVHLAGGLRSERPTLLLRLLAARPVVALGRASYSLYLTHLPVLALLHFNFERLALSPPVHAALMIMFGLGLSIGFAVMFYFAVERYFMVRLASPAAA